MSMSNNSRGAAQTPEIDFSRISYGALTEPINRAKVREFQRNSQQKRKSWAGVPSEDKSKAILSFALIGIAIAIFLVKTLADDEEQSFSVSAVLLACIPVVIGVLWVGRKHFMASTRWDEWYRLAHFATQNGLKAIPAEPVAPAYPGAIFSQGHDRKSFNHIKSRSGRFFDIGNYRYITGYGRDSKLHSWGYLAVKLDRRLPNMVLDSTSNNSFFGGTNLPSAFGSDQILRLEGDFNDHFTLYCPRQYERDALYVFTPDLMALLIDNASVFDVEIVDDWMFVYSAVPFQMTNSAVWQRMFQIIQTVAAKTLKQSANYRDDRVIAAGTPIVESFAASGNRIAPQGQRLRGGVQLMPFIVFGALILGALAFSTLGR